MQKKPVKRFEKVSALFDIVKKKFLCLKIRTKPRHDILDAKPLLSSVKGINKLYADTAYDAESLHSYCLERKIQALIKPRKNVRRGYARRQMMKNYSEKEYHQRSVIESGFSSLKRKYGGFVLARKSKAMKVEIYCKAISHNLGLIR